eukprot:COSAG02_NODE_2254_length_9348_cov_2.773273_5_plen_189_part_00
MRLRSDSLTESTGSHKTVHPALYENRAADKIVDMHGKLVVSEEQNLWKNENGGSVEMTRVSQDRGVSWDEAIAAHNVALKAGRPTFFAKVRCMLAGLPQRGKMCCDTYNGTIHFVLIADASLSDRVSSRGAVQAVFTVHWHGEVWYVYLCFEFTRKRFHSSSECLRISPPARARRDTVVLPAEAAYRC